MRDTHYLKEKDEFLYLFRFNLLGYLKIHNEYHPDRYRMDKAFHDSVEVIREKLAVAIKYNKPALTNPSKFPINVKLPEIELKTIEELDNYIIELRKRTAGYAMQSMTKRMPIEMLKNQTVSKVFQMLTDSHATKLQSEVEDGLEYLIHAAQLNENETYGFYSELVNNPYAWNAISSVIINSVEEFTSQVFNSEEAHRILNLECDCYNRILEEHKKYYIRKSFALIIAYTSNGNEDGQPLWVYRCPKFKNDSLWHITKKIQNS